MKLDRAVTVAAYGPDALCRRSRRNLLWGSHLPSTPFKNSLSDNPKAADRAAKCLSPTSRTPRSRSEM